jgi:hypothetical protein
VESTLSHNNHRKKLNKKKKATTTKKTLGIKLMKSQVVTCPSYLGVRDWKDHIQDQTNKS